MDKFTTVRLKDLGRIITGKTPPSSDPKSYGQEYLFITPSDNFDNKYIDKTNRYLSEYGKNLLKSKLLKEESVLVTCIGSAMGKVAMNSLPAITNQQINSIEVNELFHSHYIYYCLKNNYSLLRNAASGSTALPILNKTDFEELTLQLYRSLSTQKSITNILSALDQKIALNNQINAQLEQMAKTLYDYWFVQFDFPDDNGNPYKSSGGEMVYNDILKRKIPKGWEVGKIKDYCISTGGFAFKSTEWTSYGNPVIKIKNIKEDQTLDIIDMDYIDLSNRKIDEKFKGTSGNIVIAMTGATIGKFAIIPKSDVDLYINQRVGYFNLGNNPINKLPFLINSLNMDYFRKAIFSLSNGAAQPNISNEQINNINLLLPHEILIQEFNQKLKSNYSLILNNQYENQQLFQLRDFLLPMLMNGQVGISNE